MKIKSLLLTCILTAALSSCSTISHTAKSIGVDTDIYNLTVADMDVAKEKVSKTAEWKWSPLSSVSLGEQKKTAEAQLLKDANADVLVEPRYEVTRRGFMRGGTVTVTGYPATYRNFRPMTQKDAEVIATTDGRIGLSCYPIQTTAKKKRKKQSKIAPMFGAKNEFAGRSFAALIGGPVFDTNDNFNTSMQLGAMYGHTGKSWGWYIKAVWQRIDGHDNTVNGGILTAGAIKNIGHHFGVFMGTGASTGCIEDYDGWNGYYDLTHCFAVPLDLGFQYAASKFTVLAGITGQLTTNTDKTVHLSPFVGIGYCF